MEFSAWWWFPQVPNRRGGATIPPPRPPALPPHPARPCPSTNPQSLIHAGVVFNKRNVLGSKQRPKLGFGQEAQC